MNISEKEIAPQSDKMSNALILMAVTDICPWEYDEGSL